MKQHKQKIILLTDVISGSDMRSNLATRCARMLHKPKLSKLTYPQDKRNPTRLYITESQLKQIKERYKTWYFKCETFEWFLTNATKAMQSTTRYI